MCLVDVQQGSYQAGLLMVIGQDREGKKQARSGQVLGIVAQVALVDTQRGLPVELIQHIAFRPGGLAWGPEALPASKGTVGKMEGVAVKTDGQHQLF